MQKFKFSGFLALVAVSTLALFPIQARSQVSVTPANASYLTLPTKTAAITNGQAITLTNTYTLLSNAGASATTTNTLAAPTVTNGLIVVVQVAAAQTNSTIISQSSTANLAGDQTLTAGGNPLILVSANAKWWQLSGPGTGLVVTNIVGSNTILRAYGNIISITP
jgi:hypothetical protein